MKGLSRSQPLLHARIRCSLAGSQLSQQPVGQLPWGHITVLLDKTRHRRTDRAWYAAAAVEYGWSRNVLLNMIMNKTLERTGAAPSNFVQQLVAPDSELAQQVAKDPYNFEFLGLSGEVAERDLENALTSRITETLRELGPGFSFVGRQVHFDVDGDDFYVDLLFFHIEQSRYVVIELKTGKFQPEYAGKLNFYVALVDDVLRREHHNETIGILICGTKNDRSVRYSLGRSTSPMAVAAYTYDKPPRGRTTGTPQRRAPRRGAGMGRTRDLGGARPLRTPGRRFGAFPAAVQDQAAGPVVGLRDGACLPPRRGIPGRWCTLQFRQPRTPEKRMTPVATDYDEVRSDVKESQDRSLEALQSANAPDARSVVRELDESDALDEAMTPGGEFVAEELIVQVIPQAEDEFTCYSCFLVRHRSQLAREKNGHSYCIECEG